MRTSGCGWARNARARVLIEGSREGHVTQAETGEAGPEPGRARAAGSQQKHELAWKEPLPHPRNVSAWTSGLRKEGTVNVHSSSPHCGLMSCSPRKMTAHLSLLRPTSEEGPFVLCWPRHQGSDHGYWSAACDDPRPPARPPGAPAAQSFSPVPTGLLLPGSACLPGPARSRCSINMRPGAHCLHHDPSTSIPVWPERNSPSSVSKKPAPRP